MKFEGAIIGFLAFLIIGVFHPIVIKAEYYFTSKICPVFLIFGIIFFIISVNLQNNIISSLFGILSFTCFWSMEEVKQQEIRVKKGWFPKNPKRKNKE